MNAMYMSDRSWAPHLRTLRQTFETTPALLASRAHRDARLIVIALRRRVRRLITALERSISMNQLQPAMASANSIATDPHQHETGPTSPVKSRPACSSDVSARDSPQVR